MHTRITQPETSVSVIQKHPKTRQVGLMNRINLAGHRLHFDKPKYTQDNFNTSSAVNQANLK
mgnify:FL=1